MTSRWRQREAPKRWGPPDPDSNTSRSLEHLAGAPPDGPDGPDGPAGWAPLSPLRCPLPDRGSKRADRQKAIWPFRLWGHIAISLDFSLPQFPLHRTEEDSP